MGTRSLRTYLVLLASLALVLGSTTGLAIRAHAAPARAATGVHDDHVQHGAPSHLHTSSTAQCTGYAEPRVALEGQGWWLDQGVDPMLTGHVHIGACVPLNQRVSGTLPLDITIKLHNQAARIQYVAATTNNQILQKTAGCYGFMVCAKFTPTVSCTTADCSFTVHLDLPTEWIANDGRTEITIATGGLRPDGTAARAGLSWMSTLANGKPVLNSTLPFDTRSSGWHQETLYTNGAFGQVPVAPVSGTWAPSFRSLINGGAPITEHEVRVDPNFHMNEPGIIITSGQGPLTGSLLIDTTKLTNGPHKLFFRVGAQASLGTNSGVMVVPFTVQN